MYKNVGFLISRKFQFLICLSDKIWEGEREVVYAEILVDMDDCPETMISDWADSDAAAFSLPIDEATAVTAIIIWRWG